MTMHGFKHFIHRPVTRREMLGVCKCGFGSVAFMSLFGSIASACSKQDAGQLLSPSTTSPHFVPKAKNVIFLYMDGGPSQVDTFDHKPRLEKENGQDPNKKFKVDATQFANVGNILKSPWSFKRYGQSGMEVSEVFPHI